MYDITEGEVRAFFQRMDEAMRPLLTSSVIAIYEEHKGTITVESEEGRGATFTICLPVTSESKTTAHAAQA